MLEEQRCRPVQERMSRQLRPPDETDELKVHQRLQVCGHVHTAYVLYFALRQRLAVCYDRQGLE